MPVQPPQPTAKGPAEWFTGDVFIDAIVRGEEPSHVRVSAVHFTPSARGGAVEQIRAGDVVHTPADEWHWHGAAPGHFMSHLSITEAVAGDERPEANWGDHVTDDEYHQR